MAHITATKRPASDLTEGYPVPQCEERARLHLATYMYQTRCSLFWSTNSFVHQPVYSVSQVYESGVCSTFCTTSGTTSGTPGTHQFYFQLLAPWATHPCVMHSCALFMHPCAMHHLCSLCIPHLTQTNSNKSASAQHLVTPHEYYIRFALHPFSAEHSNFHPTIQKLHPPTQNPPNPSGWI